MLLSFSVENYKNFKNKQTMYFTVAENRKGQIKDNDKLDTNTFSIGDETFIKTAVIYGENGGGKSNLIRAIYFVKNFILRPAFLVTSDAPITNYLFLRSFALDDKTSCEPSKFEIEFLLDSIRYKYSFSLDNKKIYHEKLEQLNKKTNKFFYIYERNDDNIKFNYEKYKSIEEAEIKILIKQLKQNYLFLSYLISFNNDIGKKIGDFLNEKLIVILNDILTGIPNGISTAKKLMEEDLINNDIYKEKIVDFLNSTDINVSDIKIEGKYDNGTCRVDKILFNRINNSGKEISFDFMFEESDGTKKMFNLSVDIINALEKGQILFFDELDGRLHTKLFVFLIELFIKNNKNNAQLIFTTHNTTILNNKYDLFRRDQVYIINRKENEESELYSLADFGGIQKSKSKEDLLLDDSVGGNPVVGRFTL
jgi:AAA15 family ATPase/GTPase